MKKILMLVLLGMFAVSTTGLVGCEAKVDEDGARVKVDK
jgi:hypothetical protein